MTHLDFEPDARPSVSRLTVPNVSSGAEYLIFLTCFFGGEGGGGGVGSRRSSLSIVRSTTCSSTGSCLTDTLEEGTGEAEVRRFRLD